MSNVLLIHSSVFGEKSQSLALARDFLKRFPHRSLVERALSPRTMPHLDGETFAAMATPADELTGAQRTAVALSDTLIAELEAADTIVFALPMYNFSIPSTLKAWIDHVARRGRLKRARRPPCPRIICPRIISPPQGRSALLLLAAASLAAGGSHG